MIPSMFSNGSDFITLKEYVYYNEYINILDTTNVRASELGEQKRYTPLRLLLLPLQVTLIITIILC